jgi:hypothetical protein
VRVGIDVRADARDHTLEHLVGKGSGYGFQALADTYPREIDFLDIRGQPYVVQRT